ncbi:MAG: ATP-binding cassette domain-containing protein, partial [Oscillospiraceae bacterium]|nr:ATP-binding cassette domain-containing protein [Oscillospiraceae bacterium]
MSLTVRIRKSLGSFTLDVDFQAENGVTCLLGASGCGKSMTLKCIAGIERPDEGCIELDGRVLFDSQRHIDLPPQKRKVGYLFQNYALFPNMSVRQNILCGLHREKDKAAREDALRNMLRMMQLEGLEQHKPSQLSGGQQQRAALARILVSEPKLLLLDEPFSALDGHLRDALKIELRDLLRQFGREVLMVTHSRDEAYNMSESIAV